METYFYLQRGNVECTLSTYKYRKVVFIHLNITDMHHNYLDNPLLFFINHFVFLINHLHTFASNTLAQYSSLSFLSYCCHVFYLKRKRNTMEVLVR